MNDDEPTSEGPPDGDPALTAEDRDVLRAFLQRSEVRLSTIHRVATALLSGAGLMVLWPAFARDGVAAVLRTLTDGEVAVDGVLLVVAFVVCCSVPVIALVIVFGDLTRFYFHTAGDRGGVFAPRFALNGMRVHTDDLSRGVARQLAERHHDPALLAQTLPGGRSARRYLDGQIRRQQPDDAPEPDDHRRAELLFGLAGATPMSLLDDVARTEHKLARHVRAIQVIVLRYVKALLALLTTALTVFVAAEATAAVDGSASARRVVALAVMVWAPLVVVAVASPMRWLERNLHSVVGPRASMATNPDLVRIETISAALAVVAWSSASVAWFVGGYGGWFGGAAVVVTGVVLAVAVGASLAVPGRRQRGEFGPSPVRC